MKRILVFLLTMLLLTGCVAGENVEETQAATVAEFTKPSSFYVENSPIEQQTAGAVKVYQLEESCTGIAAVGGNVVLVTDLSKLILMDSQTGEPGTAIKAGETISTQTPDFTASRKGITYYREEGNELVFLSTALRQVQTVEIPEGISSTPCVSRVNEEVYYSKDNGVYAQSLQTGEIRLLFSGNYQNVQLQTTHLDGTILACAVTDAEGVETILYLDAASGKILADSTWLPALQTEADRYLLRRKDGIVTQTIYGTRDGENYVLNLEQPVALLPQTHGAYRYSVVNGALEMDYYDFDTGIHSGHVRLEGVTEEPVSVTADDRHIWILAADQLFRWDPALTPADEQAPCLETLYTRENPDMDGLALCAQRAQELTDQYGIYVTIGEENSPDNGGYEITGEHQVLALTRMLDEAETVLQQFPEGFLDESLASGDIHIVLVRAISGGREMVQFYEDGESYILVAATENIRLNILHGLSYMIDSHVLGNSWAYENWKNLNPQDFDYDYTYYSYQNHQDSVYLTNAERAFVDAYAMTFPHEDRSMLFAYAMMDGCADYFASDTMQAKLALICEGIREAYSYWQSDGTFLWEQYLLEK